MKLPVIDTRSVYTTFLPVLNREVQFKPYSMGEEKCFLIPLEDNDHKALYINLKALIEKCVIDKLDFETMSTVDFMKLVFAIRAKSKSEALTVSRKCPKCDVVNKIEIPDIELALKIKNAGKLSETIKITDELYIEVKPMEATYVKDLLQLMKLENKTNADILNLGLNSIAYNIAKVIFKEIIYTDWTTEELIERVIEGLTEKQLGLISDGINKLVSMYIEVAFNCTKCDHSEVIREENFFVLL